MDGFDLVKIIGGFILVVIVIALAGDGFSGIFDFSADAAEDGGASGFNVWIIDNFLLLIIFGGLLVVTFIGLMATSGD